ncbi:MAG: condensation domain-containing protein, partial [Bacteroidota bacterium]
EFGAEGFKGHQLNEMLSTGEQLYLSGGLRDFLETHPEIKIYNVYGPSEAHCVTSIVYQAQKATLPVEALIGKPLNNTALYLLDSTKQLVPVGLEGELYIEGHGLALGYKNNPKETQDKFIDHPFKPGQQVYRTGDLAKWLPDGNIAYCGRKDKQIKLNGYRIELGEIETILEAAPGVKNGAVKVHQSGGNKQLVAYVVPEKEFHRDQVHQYLAEQLPDYMLPSVWMELAVLPLNSNGKLDRKALPQPLVQQAAYQAPRDAYERLLSNIWTQLLGRKQIGVRENFFEIGGHSLMAMRLIAAVRKSLKKQLKVKDVFTNPSIEGLAKLLRQAQIVQDEQALQRQERPAKIPLSFAQERLWFIDQLSGSVQYHMPTVLRLGNAIDRAVLADSLSDLIDRHEALRVVLKADEAHVYQAVQSADNWQLQYTEEAEEEKVQALIQTSVEAVFDLSKDYLLRAHLIRCAKMDHVLVLVMHHIATDGWSNAILVKDLMEMYDARQEGRTPHLPALPLQYPDYAIWQRQAYSTQKLAIDLDWWATYLEDLSPLMLPTDFPRPSVQSNRGDHLGFVIEATLMQDLKDLAITSGTTMFMLLLAALKIVLARYSGQTDICVGTALANRNRQELEGMVGFFVNTIALRNPL